MRRAPSTLLTIVGFGVAIAFVSVAATVSAVLWSVPPPVARFTAMEAVTALRDGSGSRFDRSIEATSVVGIRATLVEEIIAEALGRPGADVRAAYRGRFRTTTRRSIERSSDPPGAVTRSAIRFDPTGGQELAVSSTTKSLREFRDAKLPPFATSVRTGDGRWLTVEPRLSILGGLRGRFLRALAIAFVLLIPLAWLLARRLKRPFAALTRSLNVGGALPSGGPREVRETAAAIDAMRTRLTSEAAERARMLAAIAHDLRTPLMGLRLRLETVPEPQRSKMVADVERMRAMIADVLAFARGGDERRERVEVRSVLEEVVADFDGDDRVELLPGPDVAVLVDATAFRRAIDNLVRNAVDYAGRGRLRVERTATSAAILCEDNGPGIAEGERDRLMRPFERGDASRNRATGGVGLGLSIVSSFASEHGGSLALSDAAGGGLAALLSLPLVTDGQLRSGGIS